MGKIDETKQKDWWAPVWKGLVMDADAVHFHAMGNAVWLFLYFLVNANRSTGVLMRRTRTISSEMGLPRSTTFRWLKILRTGGYIETLSSGHSLTIQIRKWRPVGDVPKLGREKSQFRDPRSAKSETSDMPQKSANMAQVREESGTPRAPNDNTIKENILKSDIDRLKIDFRKLCPSACKTREELLAFDLAEALHDLPGFPLYLSYARKYPESLLRETMGRVREVPPGKIKTSRGALFNFLIQRHAK